MNVSKVKESEIEDKLTSKKLDGVITLASGFQKAFEKETRSY